jgi:hypothetical protein
MTQFVATFRKVADNVLVAESSPEMERAALEDAAVAGASMADALHGKEPIRFCGSGLDAYLAEKRGVIAATAMRHGETSMQTRIQVAILNGFEARIRALVGRAS